MSNQTSGQPLQIWTVNLKNMFYGGNSIKNGTNVDHAIFDSREWTIQVDTPVWNAFKTQMFDLDP